MQKLQLRSLFGFSIWLVITLVGFMGVAFGAKTKEGPKLLNHENIQQVTSIMSHNHAEVWHVNGQVVLTQQTELEDGLESALDLLDRTAVQIHLSQSARNSMRSIDEPVLHTMRDLPERLVLENKIPDTDTDIVTVASVSEQDMTYDLLIDPRKYNLDVQSRWGVRSQWSNRSYVVKMLHNSLLKEDLSMII